MVSCIVDYMGQVLWSLAHIRPHASPKPIISLVLGPNLGTGVFLCCPQILASPNASHQKDLVTLWGPTWSGTPHLCSWDRKTQAPAPSPLPSSLALSFPPLLSEFLKPRICPSFPYESGERRSYQATPRVCLSPSSIPLIQTVDIFQSSVKIYIEGASGQISWALTWPPPTQQFCSHN